MTLAEILILTGASPATIYRWIDERGFPRGFDGRRQQASVEAWWAVNRNRVGRWPREAAR